eukprot:m.92008 g.92008  ORF g.92008 m.92008 type:complete len:308 (-) comp20217_c0_seq1:299-1222(-)
MPLVLAAAETSESCGVCCVGHRVDHEHRPGGLRRCVELARGGHIYNTCPAARQTRERHHVGSVCDRVDHEHRRSPMRRGVQLSGRGRIREADPLPHGVADIANGSGVGNGVHQTHRLGVRKLCGRQVGRHGSLQGSGNAAHEPDRRHRPPPIPPRALVALHGHTAVAGWDVHNQLARTGGVTAGVSHRHSHAQPQRHLSVHYGSRENRQSKRCVTQGTRAVSTMSSTAPPLGSTTHVYLHRRGGHCSAQACAGPAPRISACTPRRRTRALPLTPATHPVNTSEHTTPSTLDFHRRPTCSNFHVLMSP